MIEFRLVKANDSDTFEENVNKKIAEGWELHGSMTRSSNWSYVQPMTRQIKKAKRIRSHDRSKVPIQKG